ncbi:curli production assembly/transport component CsgF [Flavobacterium sp. FlaQc-52]|uniref:Curli production assembly/transport component CsgF n=1 Tax=Flavobacterium cupriresistens TaxID=2893885 RepID=A0ABU4R823_9FLAO|nr:MULTISPECIES: curli production assembly/transport component CsgF [unclassified Flavobacterium]MDX6188381.1 curli assembly protein CsgF [Flavobacterium sp. Fl-318]UFH44948.1 curli assembly protein CsgF [Flavobacterium sp. F-323]
MKFILTTAIVVFLIPLSIRAQALVYKPVNPAFGGDTFNYQWLLSSAEAQNKQKDKTVDTTPQTDLERFKANLNSQLLSQISSTLYKQQFGTDGIKEGSYTFGSFSIDVYPSADGLTLNILDTNTGEQTQVIIPNQ